MEDKNKKKILVVDDEEIVLSFLVNMLKNSEYEVFSAARGQEAIELAKSIVPDLIVLDIILPDIMGGEVFRILSETPATADIPIIFLSGLNTREDINVVKAAGGYQMLLAKPIIREELLAAVSKILEQSSIERKL